MHGCRRLTNRTATDMLHPLQNHHMCEKTLVRSCQCLLVGHREYIPQNYHLRMSGVVATQLTVPGCHPSLFPGILLLRTSVICCRSRRVIIPLSILYAVHPRIILWKCLRLTVRPDSNGDLDCNYLALPPHNAL